MAQTRNKVSYVSLPKFLLCILLVSCFLVCLPMLLVGVANGNIHPHIPTLHEIWQFFLSSLAD